MQKMQAVISVVNGHVIKYMKCVHVHVYAPCAKIQIADTHTHTSVYTSVHIHSYLHHIVDVTADLSNVVRSLKELLAVKLPACVTT